MPVSSTTIHEQKILRKNGMWQFRFQTNFDDGRFQRVKLFVSDFDLELFEGLPERPNPDYDPEIDPPENATLPAVPPDPTALDLTIAQAEEICLSRIKQQDADEGIDADTDIAANKEATQQERAVAYLRKAWQEQDSYQAYRLLDRFNTYRTNQGWTLNQVQANLAAAGLTVEEWDSIKTAYQFLSAGTRPAEMAAASVIQETWEARS